MTTGDATPTSTKPATAPAEGQGAEDGASYIFMTIKAIRGREGATKTKWQSQGWEFVSQSQGTLRSELSFRKVKPKGLGTYITQGYAAFRRLNPRTQWGLAAGLSALLLAGIFAIVVGTQGAGDPPRPAASPITNPATAPASSLTPPAEPSSAAPPPPKKPAVTDITVDGLVDKVNSANMGGMKVGDQFRMTGELVGADYWTTGASGDFFVTLKTKTGSDLIVFVEQSEAEGWQDGTKVEMVVENVKVTINGETTDGWFKARSARTIAGGTT